MQVTPATLRKRLAFWVNQGVLKEDGHDTFVVVEKQKGLNKLSGGTFKALNFGELWDGDRENHPVFRFYLSPSYKRQSLGKKEEREGRGKKEKKAREILFELGSPIFHSRY